MIPPFAHEICHEEGGEKCQYEVHHATVASIWDVCAISYSPSSLTSATVAPIRAAAAPAPVSTMVSGAKRMS